MRFPSKEVKRIKSKISVTEALSVIKRHDLHVRDRFLLPDLVTIMCKWRSVPCNKIHLGQRCFSETSQFMESLRLFGKL